jgi:hypothetical protein
MKKFAKTSTKLSALALAAACVLGTSAWGENDSAKYAPASAQASDYNTVGVVKTYTLVIKAPSSLNERGEADLSGAGIYNNAGKEQFAPSAPGIDLDIVASVIPPEGVSQETALAWLSVSENTWTCLALNEQKEITVTLNIPPNAAPVGDYVFTVAANPPPALGWGVGGHNLTASIAQYVAQVPTSVEQPFVLDVTAPQVNITAPTLPSFTYVTGGTPVDVAFDASEIESPITSLAGSVAGAPIALTVSGEGTKAKSATGIATVGPVGVYTFTATATNTRTLPNPNPDSLPANLTGSATVDFSVNYDMSNCWLPPLSLGKISKGGSTVPIKFTAKDANGLFVADNSVQVKVSEIVVNAALQANDVLVSSGSFGTGSGAVRIDQLDAYTGQYIANFQTATGAHKYRVDVFFNGSKQASKEFSVSAK